MSTTVSASAELFGGKPPLAIVPKADAQPRQTQAGHSQAESGLPHAHAGGAGDHHAVHQFLVAVFQGPSRDSFLGSLDDPYYEPSDRLLVKQAGQVLSHLHATRRVMHFDGLKIPVAGISWLGTLPECRGRGYARHLLALAEQQARTEGALLGLLSTKVPHFFRPQGWAVCGRHSHSSAGTRDVLAQLSAQGALAADCLTVRPWRQVELPSLMRLHSLSTAAASGCFQRTEAYWRWLISRKEFDQICVAIEGPDRLDADGCGAKIVGYCITRDDRVLELFADPQSPAAPAHLLARACSDAIERNVGAVTLHAPPHDPLHGLLRTARGLQHHHEAHQGEVFMMRLLDPRGLLVLLSPLLQRRWDECAGGRRGELGLKVEGHKHHLALSRRRVKITSGRLGRNYLRLNVAELTRLMLGHVDPEEAIAGGRLQSSTRLAAQTARAIFPRLPLWRPPLDVSLG